MLCVLGALLLLIAGGSVTRDWGLALAWGAMAVGMIFFSGVALINGWVMHYLVDRGAPASDPMVYDAFNQLLIAYGWLGNPLFLFVAGRVWRAHLTGRAKQKSCVQRKGRPASTWRPSGPLEA